MSIGAVIAATKEAVAQDATAGAVEFGTESELVGLTEVDVQVGEYVFKVDEPAALGGGGKAPNPVEFALASLGSCQAITYRFWAEKLGITFDMLSVNVGGDLDVRGFFGLDDGVRPGFGTVRVDVRISGPEPEERYRELQRAVDQHCPVLDIFANSIPVETKLAVG